MAMPGICSSASLTADYGPGPEAAAEGCRDSWTGNSLSTSPAADFGPGPEAAAEGLSAGQGVYASRLAGPPAQLVLHRRAA